MYKWCHESRRNYTFVNLKDMKNSKRRVFVLVTLPCCYRKNDQKRAVVWPWLVLKLCTVLALTQLGIWQSDWWRAGIRSTDLHIVLECIIIILLADGLTSVYVCRDGIWRIKVKYELRDVQRGNKETSAISSLYSYTDMRPLKCHT